MQKGPCFRCQKEGHWARDCPYKPQKAELCGTGPAFVDGQIFPEMQCPCGAGTCLILTSKTEKNPSRKFYKCPAAPGRKCSFFKWCDMVSSESESNGSSTSQTKSNSFQGQLSDSQNIAADQQPISQMRLRDTLCYCQKPGHFAGDCPNIPENKIELPGDRFTVVDAISLPEKQCRCGIGTCLILTSNSQTNPGRKYYKCPGTPINERTCSKMKNNDLLNRTVGIGKKIGGSHLHPPLGCQNLGADKYNALIRQRSQSGRIRECYSNLICCTVRFFDWCDTVNSNQEHDVSQSPYPKCSCGAGVCSLLTVKNGEYVGRKFFVCPVKKGQGACNFFQWQDSPEKTTSISHLDENNSLSSAQTTSNVQEETEMTIDDELKDEDSSELERMLSYGLADELTTLCNECDVMVEMVGSGSGVHDTHLPPISSLNLRENGMVGAVAEPEECSLFGNEEHFMMKCIGLLCSPCFNCGKEPASPEGATSKKGYPMTSWQGVLESDCNVEPASPEGATSKKGHPPTSWKGVLESDCNVLSCILEFDGASKGNPGQAGAGAVLRAEDESVVWRLREGVGFATNNVAEYRALILGLKIALKKAFKHIRVQGDSKLVCMQVEGLWKTKNQNMFNLCMEAKELKDKFLSFQISHVVRDKNSEADAQANLAVNLKDGEVQEECERCSSND